MEMGVFLLNVDGVGQTLEGSRASKTLRNQEYLGAMGPIKPLIPACEAHDKMVEAGLMAPFLGAVGTFELYSLWLFFKGWAPWLRFFFFSSGSQVKWLNW